MQDFTVRMENQVERIMEDEVDTGVLDCIMFL